MIITKTAFKLVLRDPNMAELLEDLEVPASSANSIFDTLDADNSGTLSVHELIDGIMRLQGCSRNDVATLVRVKALQHRVRSMENILENAFPTRTEMLQSYQRPAAPGAVDALQDIDERQVSN
mmetsp:Transcript_116763/g.190078  ORF Transcript_116763/g.190078 Transcript_116763/m.190078 type:complete len:123 (+) Transcript_116763:95-463(+)